MGVIIAVQGLYGCSVLSQAGDMVIDTFDRPLMAVNYARAANFDLSQIERKLLERSITASGDHNRIDAEIDTLKSAFDEDLAVAEQRSSGSDELTQIGTIRRLMGQWSSARAAQRSAHMTSLSRKMDATFDLLIEYNTDHSFIGRRKAVDAITHFRYLLGAGLLASLVIAVAITVLLSRRIARPLAQAASVARSISTGEFETAIPDGGDDETGALLRSMKVMQDNIRAMVARESARAASAEGRLAVALETSDEGVILVGPDGRIAMLNSRLRAFFPAAASVLVPGTEYALAKSLMRDEFADPEADDNGEHRLPDGRWVRLTDSPTTDGGSIIFLSEFTAIKEREESFRTAKQAAEAASAAKSRFLANMSHELRTPLNAIIGFSEVISGQMFGAIANARYVEYATDILRSGRHLLDVINSVLDLSKSEAGKLTLNAEMVDLRYILKDCVTMVADQCAKAGLSFTTAGLDRELPVMGEKAKLRQIFLNLLSNAMKFTERGGRVALMAEEDNDRILVRVVDTGIGMSQDEIKVALTAFGQVDNRLERKFEGTGLGLPLAASLTDLHGGELVIDSVVRGGTTVTIAFGKASQAVSDLRVAS